VTGKQREELRVGNDAMARHRRDSPDRFAPPVAPGMPAGENGAQFASLPFGYEEAEPEDSGQSFPIAKPRPARIGTKEPDSLRGFRMFELPLTAEGEVDKDALVPGSVYRIPDSAGGGTGQWKGGAFYNFDRKADWRIHTVEGLDAYSGVSGRPTPEERQARTIKELDDTFMPPAYLDEERIAAFRQATGYGLTRGEGGFTLTDPSGHELLDLAEGDAAELARLWSPDIADRVTAIGLIWRKDLTPPEKRKLLKEAVAAEEPLTGRVLTDRREIAEHLAKFAASNLAGKRLDAFDAVAEAMERGASDEQIGELLGAFNAAMLPELLGTERFVQDLLKDLAPGLGNVRSFRHLQNDIAEIEQAVATGKWDDATLATGMAVLDAIGIFPGGNFVKQGGKLAGRGLVISVPYLDGLLAERTIRRFKAQWDDSVNKIDPRRFIGEFFDRLDPDLRKRVGGLVNDRVGEVSEKELLELGKRMDPKAADEVGKELPDGFQIKTRKYDMEATFASHVVAEKYALLGRLARWVANAGGESLTAVKAARKQIELKTGKKDVPPRQRQVDKFFAENPDEASKAGVNEVIYLRRHPEEVSIDFVIHDLSNYLDGWVKSGRIGRYEATALKEAMKKTWAKGVTRVAVEEYAGLLARLAAATSRDADIDDIARPEFGEDAYP